MVDYSYASELFFSELMRISSDIVWKNDALAKENEDSSYSIAVDQYILARQGKLTFDLIFSFDYDVLIASGLTPQQAEYGSEVSTEIPLNKRDLCTANQISHIINNYEESNNYYRMLNGLPDLDDTLFLYNTDYPLISDDITPIHLLPIDKLYELESRGYIDKLIKEYPDKKYLKYMTSKKIDPYTARNSDPFAILWIGRSVYASLVDDFKETYTACNYMITSVFNSKNLQVNNIEYTGFIGMVILFTTIMQMNKKYLDADITRDFYDEDSLRYIYDSYGVPFYASIPMEYHRSIVKNINRLISYKGSTHVIFELFDIFGLNDTSIYEYYLFKVHKFKDGKPVFVKNEDGTYDKKAMYDVKFAKVKLYNDPVSDIIDPVNHVDYNNMVHSDPYWVSDKELLDKLYEEEYNYIESKYLGIQTTFDMMKILYESCYYLKMIIDNRKSLVLTNIYNNNTRSYVNLFDSVIYLCALMCKKYGYEGNIPTDPHEVGKVLGFNFSLDLSELQKHISETDYLKNDKNLLNYLSTLNVYSLESIRVIYDNLTSLHSYLVNKMAETAVPEEYWVYYELYNSIMYSEYVEGVFKKSDGSTAESFADMLLDCNSVLHERLTGENIIDIDDEISYMIYLLKSSCDELKHIQYMDNINIDIIIEYLMKMIDFFKSAKADITDYTIIYTLASAIDNRIKLMNYIEKITDKTRVFDYVDELDDLIHICRELIHFKDAWFSLLTECRSEFHQHFVQSQIDIFDDYIKVISELVFDLSTNAEFYDSLSDMNIYLLDDELQFGDSLTLLYDDVKEIIKYIVNDEYSIFDTICTISEVLKSNNQLSSNSLFELKIMYILMTQNYQVSYKICDILSDLLNVERWDFEVFFTDNIVPTITKYFPESMGTVQYEDYIKIIKEFIRSWFYNSDYTLKGKLEIVKTKNKWKFYDIITDELVNLTQYYFDLCSINTTEAMIHDIINYIKLEHCNIIIDNLSKITTCEHLKSFIGFMGKLVSSVENKLGLNATMFYTDMICNISCHYIYQTCGSLEFTDEVTSSDRVVRKSSNILTDQLILRHESIIEE